MMNKAFTLVELAIVIVIIGLLVSGVLVGKELIEQAKIRAQIKQFEEFNAAIVTFKGKYNFLPGDMPYQRAQELGFQTAYVAGQVNPNGDGMINDFNGRVPPQFAWSEAKYFFIQLNQAKMISGLLGTVIYGQFFAVGAEFPPDKLGYGGIAAISLADGQLYYYMGPSMKQNSTNNSDWVYISPTPTSRPDQALDLDTKLDDGNPATGGIKAVQLSYTYSQTFTNDIAANGCVNASGKYDISTTDNKCRLVVLSAGK